jgi:hypothetical protein
MDNSVIAALAAALAAEDEAGGLPATREFGRGAAHGRSVAAAAAGERPWYPDSISSEDSLSFDSLTLRSPSVPTKYFIGKRGGGRTETCTGCYLQYTDVLRIWIGIQG